MAVSSLYGDCLGMLFSREGVFNATSDRLSISRSLRTLRPTLCAIVIRRFVVMADRVEPIENAAFVTPCDCCQQKNGDLRCGKCKCMYYCSRECQARAWREHKSDCTALAASHIEFSQTDRKMDDRTKRKEDAASEVCAICLEQIEDNSLELPCQHVFCIECMKLHHKNSASTNTPCPLCRAETNVHQYVYVNAVNFFNRAYRQPSRKDHFCQMARKELKPIENESRGSPEIQSLIAELLYLEEKYADAIALSESILKNKPAMSMVFSNLTNIIQSHLKLSQFKSAFLAIQRMLPLTSDPSEYAKEVRFLYQSTCRCYYEFGEYAQAIRIGDAAVEANRHYEGVHKYIALSYKALGRYDEAILTMRRAVRYEQPWDARNVAANQALLDELVAEKKALDTKEDMDGVAVKRVA